MHLQFLLDLINETVVISAMESLEKMTDSDSDSRNFKNFDCDSMLANKLTLLLIKIMW